MGPVRLIIAAVRILLAIGLTCGYGNVIRHMANAAVHAQTHNTFSAAKFNRALWTKGKVQVHHAQKLKGETK